VISDEADHAPQENAFFSASVKGLQSLPFYVTNNYRVSLDGTKALACNDDLMAQKYNLAKFSIGVSGIMDEEEYRTIENNGCFNHSTVNPNVDYNWYDFFS
jgi:hypothetical protein